MEPLFAQGRIALIILGFILVEGAVLLVWHRRTGRGLPPRDTASLLLPGACLLVALYAAMTGGWWGWIALALAGSLVAHLLDVAARWR
jgi:hypothetical protein